MDTRLTTPRRENHVEETIEQQIAELSRMTVGQLKQKYIEVFGEESVEVPVNVRKDRNPHIRPASTEQFTG